MTLSELVEKSEELTRDLGYARSTNDPELFKSVHWRLQKFSGDLRKHLLGSDAIVWRKRAYAGR